MTRTQKIIYWVATLWLALGMTSTGIVQLMRMKDDVDRMAHLGYPAYLLTILGIWKLLGVVAVLIPRYPLIKEWAYAGFFFSMSGAAISHIIMGDPFGEIFPSVLLLILTMTSWYFRPASRRFASERAASGAEVINEPVSANQLSCLNFEGRTSLPSCVTKQFAIFSERGYGGSSG